MAKDDERKRAPRTLSDEEVSTGRRVGRRSMLGALGAGVFGGAAATVLSGCFAHTSSGGVVLSGLTDGDSGACADPSNHGWGNTGLTDGDAGQCADPAGRGRATGLSDSDSGDFADAAGRGRRGT